MREVKFQCPHCNQSIEAPEEMLGSIVDCPSCDKRLQLPQPASALTPSPLTRVTLREKKPSLKCKLGFHAWVGDACSACGKTRQPVESKNRETNIRWIEISTVEELQAIHKNLAGHYKLVADIRASDTRNWHPVGGIELPKGFRPLGTADKSFRGIFDGAGHKITSLSINREQDDGVGLFAYNQGVIRNVCLERAHIYGKRTVGGLVGNNKEGGTVAGCSSTSCLISGKRDDVGGLVGSNSGAITGCSVSYGELGNILGVQMMTGLVEQNAKSGKNTESYGKLGNVVGPIGIGGLVGLNAKSGKITESSASSVVTIIKLAVGEGYDAGGLVGVNHGTITRCSASGEVSGGTEIGGLVGTNDGTITCCSAYGKVDGKKTIGGFAGKNEGTITCCLASGHVSGIEDTGGLVGRIGWPEKGMSIGCYWDLQTSRQKKSSGGEGRGSSQMKQEDIFVDWDFAKVWQIEEGRSYPTLRCLAENQLLSR